MGGGASKSSGMTVNGCRIFLKQQPPNSIILNDHEGEINYDTFVEQNGRDDNGNHLKGGGRRTRRKASQKRRKLRKTRRGK